MKKQIAALLALLLLFTLAGCRREEELEPWTMPAVDTKPTPVPTAAPSFGVSNPERIVWNEAAYLNMDQPGAAPDSVLQTLTHRQTAALYPYNFLPASVFGESYAAYDKLSLKKTEHQVLLDGTGALAEHAWVEFVYLPKSLKPEEGLYVMAELCSYDAAYEIYGGVYPHVLMPAGERLQSSSSYLRDFVLFRVGQQRAAMMLKLVPSSYFADAQRAMAEAAEAGEPFTPSRQVFLTVTCGLGMSDEEFTAAVTTLLRFSDGSEIVTPEPSRLPVFGEKGAA
jgi:hypothetical protein